jgi:hypothetical protein
VVERPSTTLSARDTFRLMNADDSARDVSHTDWVAAAMAGRGSGTPPPETGGTDVAYPIAVVIMQAFGLVVGIPHGEILRIPRPPDS